MKITAIVEDAHGLVVEIVIDHDRRHRLADPVPRAKLADAAASIAAMAGYTVDFDTLELTPIHASDAPQN